VTPTIGKPVPKEKYGNHLVEKSTRSGLARQSARVCTGLLKAVNRTRGGRLAPDDLLQELQK
jgi:hypothetical protein